MVDILINRRDGLPPLKYFCVSRYSDPVFTSDTKWFWIQKDPGITSYVASCDIRTIDIFPHKEEDDGD